MKSWLAIFIRNLVIFYWFLTRPTTHGAKAGIFYGDKILLVRLTYYPDTWTFPGGMAKKNETPRETLIRECREEVGITLRDPEHVGDLYLEQQYKKDTVSVFKATATNSVVIIDNREIAETRWCELHDLPPMGKNSRAMLNLVLDQGN